MSIEPRTKLRAVLDSNVYVSGFIDSRGASYRIWRQAVARGYCLLVSPSIVNEVGSVLRRKFGFDESSILRNLKSIAGTAELVVPTARLTVFHGKEESDNRILECAIAGNADLIVSGDSDLRNLRVFRGIPIVRPADAARIFDPS